MQSVGGRQCPLPISLGSQSRIPFPNSNRAELRPGVKNPERFFTELDWLRAAKLKTVSFPGCPEGNDGVEIV